jgi:glycosyltransferase involved in cell wall biosynthesis
LKLLKFSRGWTATKADLSNNTIRTFKSNVVQNWGVRSKGKSKSNLQWYENIKRNLVKRKNEENNIKFITVGRLAPWKNIDSIIKCYEYP